MGVSKADDLQVRVVHLEPMRVASSYGFGTSPEEIAWKKMLEWAKAKGVPDKPQEVRFFGFNNPNPSAESPSYGYEQWMTVGPDIGADDDIEIKAIPRGMYLVTRCTGLQNIGEVWARLLMWQEGSGYEMAPGYCLEECINPPPEVFEQVVMDLYLPVAEGK